ncbi:MAG: HAD family hydrolase [Candidatus Abyssobacteria bacterium SURF_5]|uniref:HAD family hydrolase n=1 Tax=Abyssobacteria bacterium (strain SURF_5) TaxID=2093360 RepID=A0A3A4NPK3_ABYX5|nr:MAG: HAD family hydrolase [Candidatus Abyssubacteria bacterium SURF_5]
MTDKQKKISTVFFDFGDTLVEGRPAYLHRVADLLAEFGFRHEVAEVVHAFNKADYLVYVDHQSGSLSVDGQYMMRFLHHFGECLGVKIDWKTLLPQILRKFDDQPYERALADGAIETLGALRDKGYRLGVISNNDGSCRTKCEALGIADFFKVIVDSSIEGVRKPAPKIFEIALERMKISPREAMHVGDMYGSDVLGARDVEIQPVWYNQNKVDAFSPYRPAHTVEQLAQILDFV